MTLLTMKLERSNYNDQEDAKMMKIDHSIAAAAVVEGSMISLEMSYGEKDEQDGDVNKAINKDEK